MSFNGVACCFVWAIYSSGTENYFILLFTIFLYTTLYIQIVLEKSEKLLFILKAYLFKLKNQKKKISTEPKNALNKGMVTFPRIYTCVLIGARCTGTPRNLSEIYRELDGVNDKFWRLLAFCLFQWRTKI
ncbi:hypothetical protein [Bacillus sp. 522_BSPC]|uniref:hypothetical protein n=1 Tax=Bacillus sp. 522_BSPC TaxID=1579338 RepID=UPI00065FCC17|nr:hypothetical protein [Bacillus sp. 522_BSPC]